MTAFPWTPEQEDVLASTARITLVQAGPGSGKTKVFAELVDRRLSAWGERRGGLAALSFTNAARAEIEDRVRAATMAPHFIGTLDAFFLRFVIAPFGHLAGLPKAGARLIASPLDQQITRPEVVFSATDRASIFWMTATSGTESAPQFQVRRPNGVPARPVASAHAFQVLQLKKNDWAATGRVTHGDCSYLTACILLGKHGAAVRATLARRFPVICIDEFQDTGHFLGRAVLSLLTESTIESVVVGDVDQKIFGFSGVNPNLFDQVEALPGAKKYPLQISQRCSTRVCEVASMLSRSNSKVLPRAAAEAGKTFKTHHKDGAGIDLKLLDKVIPLARAEGCKELAVLVRTRIVKARFLRLGVRTAPAIASRGVVQIVRSLEAVKERKGRQGIDIAQALVCRILVDDDRPTEDQLLAAGIEPQLLRRHVRQLLLSMISVKPGETWKAWSSRAKEHCASIAEAFAITDYKARLGHAFKIGKNDKPEEVRTAETPVLFAWPGDIETTVLTIHEAKGREFDAVLVYTGKPRKIDGATTCPSEAWWSSPAGSEEREVAFVAATRAKRLLTLAVHEQSWAAFEQHRKPFFDLFQHVSKSLSP